MNSVITVGLIVVPLLATLILGVSFDRRFRGYRSNKRDRAQNHSKSEGKKRRLLER